MEFDKFYSSLVSILRILKLMLISIV